MAFIFFDIIIILAQNAGTKTKMSYPFPGIVSFLQANSGVGETGNLKNVILDRF